MTAAERRRQIGSRARTDDTTALIIEHALHLDTRDGIQRAINYLESEEIARATILRVLSSQHYRRSGRERRLNTDA